MPVDLKARPKWQYWVGGIGGAAVVYYVYERQKAKSAAAATDTTTTDPNIDPNTGQPWSSEAGYSSASGTTPSAYLGTYYDPTTNSYIPIGGTTGGTNIITQPGTREAWTQQVQAYLVQQGFDPLLVITAIGKYLTGQALNNQEMTVVDAARAAVGEVPGGAPAIKTLPPAGQLKTVYAVGVAQLSAPTNARALIQTHSDPNAGANAIESALRKTVADLRNARYMPYYTTHKGTWPAKAKIYYTYVKSETTG